MGFSTRNNKISIQAREANIIKSKNNKLLRIFEYNKNPKLCKFCCKPINYEKKTKCDFCCKTCSASYNNKNRFVKEDQRKKISEKLKGRKNKYAIPPQLRNPPNLSKVYFKYCKICGKSFYVRYKSDLRKTCSRDCNTHASVRSRSYQNGSRKVTYFNNSFTNKIVLLESSWEVAVAEELEKLKINWTRPAPIRWIDKNQKSRLYYPDFYLIDYDVYLDPKNPYCMKQDAEKLAIVEKQINLIYGDVQKIIDYIRKVASE